MFKILNFSASNMDLLINSVFKNPPFLSFVG